ncbi:hypothetical protein WR25_01424 isoform A [Diploscapter pachys]|uniref:non-specific serine/threonine protein kinase n=1 Tax=Diploscapter pachys TaxID=2018661 RepID=A0A2A2JP75_9BILA|nr:hypothetical protein WR25_01424 isoform A [Diploscapter pachys]
MKVKAGVHGDKLTQIRNDLQPWTTYGNGDHNQNRQTQQHQETKNHMVDSLTKLGYDKESAAYALKKVHYESVEAAANFLKQLNAPSSSKNANSNPPPPPPPKYVDPDQPSPSSASIQQQRQMASSSSSSSAHVNGHRAITVGTTTNYEDSGSSRSNSPLPPQMPSPSYGGMRGHPPSYSVASSASPSSARQHTPLTGDYQTSHIKLTTSPHQKMDMYSQQMRQQPRPSIIIDQGGGTSGYLIRDFYKTPTEGAVSAPLGVTRMATGSNSSSLASMGGQPRATTSGYMPSPPSYNASQAHSSVPPPGVMKNFTGVPKSVVNINVTPQTRGNGRNYLLEMDRDGNPIDRFAMPSMIQEMQNMRLSHPEDERVMMNYEDELRPSTSRDMQALLRQHQERAAAAAAAFGFRPSTSATPPSYTQAIGQQNSPLLNSVTSSSSSYMMTSSLSSSTASSSHHQNPNRVITSRDRSPSSRHAQQKRGSNTTTTSSASSSYHQPVTQKASIRRCSSPLPDTIKTRLDDKKYENCISPIQAPMFKFYMEQHVERLLIQYKERERRHRQLQREMSEIKMGDQMKQKFLQLLHNKENQYMRLKRQRLSREMFEVIAGIGIGAFGKVSLVKKKDTGKPYAMKTLNKKDVIKKQQHAHVKAERDILAEADSKWIVRLYFSFQDERHLYFIMEYVPGGDLMQLLINMGIFKEDLAKFYTAELTCALEYVHSLGFIHRDIKPDNILIDQQGHIKLTDFGLCTGLRWTHNREYYPDESGAVHQRVDSFAQMANMPQQDQNYKILHSRQQRKRDKSLSVVGTGNYMAPEVILKQGHTKLCDWWSVGVILYEMVFGRPPFLSMTDNPDETRDKILNWNRCLDTSERAGGGRLKRECIDIIRRLICDTEHRLGRKGPSEVKKHPWFKDIDFNTIRDSPAPYKPTVKHPTDTSNFDQFTVC